MGFDLGEIDKDHSSNADVFRKKVKQASWFAIIAIFSLAAMYFMPSESQYLGMIPGFAMGMMACIFGNGLKLYLKQHKETKNDKKSS
jgi:hypothetical protein